MLGISGVVCMWMWVSVYGGAHVWIAKAEKALGW